MTWYLYFSGGFVMFILLVELRKNHGPREWWARLIVSVIICSIWFVAWIPLVVGALWMAFRTVKQQGNLTNIQPQPLDPGYLNVTPLKPKGPRNVL